MVAFPSLVRIDPSNQEQVAEFIRPYVEPFFKGQAWVHILDPEDRNVDTDFTTGITTVEWEPVWSGFSRVKPLRTALNSKQTINSTNTRVVQFWVDFPKDGTVGDIRPGMQIAVEDGLNDPMLSNYQYVVTGAINGSDAWQRTIETVVDLEARPEYDFTNWPKRPVA
jgi:hypothetical protein